MESVKDSLLNEDVRRKEKVNLLLEYLFMKNRKDKKRQKGMGEVKVETPMILDEDPNLENISNVTTATSVGFGKRNRMKRRKKIKRLIQLLLKVIL